MAEYIEREALKELVKKHFKLAIDAGMHSLDVVDTACAMTSLIDGVDKANVAEVRRGEWVFKRRYYDADECNCSECGQLMTTHAGKRMNYCPRCGAKMNGGADNE